MVPAVFESGPEIETQNVNQLLRPSEIERPLGQNLKGSSRPKRLPRFDAGSLRSAWSLPPAPSRCATGLSASRPKWW